MRFLLVFIFFFSTLSHIQAQKVKVIKYPELEQGIKQSEGLVLYNFWATWCRPCVAELPHFDELARHYKGSAKIVLVSLDFSKQVNTRVVPFLKKKGYSMPCVLLDEVDGEKWMGKVDETWDGAIPATLVVNHDKNVYEFHQGEMTKETLQAIIEKYK